MEHRDYADGEVAGDAAAYLEESDGRVVGRVCGVPFGEGHHVLDAGADGVDVFDVAGDYVAGEHIAHRRIFPPGHDHRQVFLHRGIHPRIL